MKKRHHLSKDERNAIKKQINHLDLKESAH